MTEKALKLAMYELCERNPMTIIDAWNDKDRSLKEMMAKAKEKGFFKVTKAGVWMWKEHQMGINSEQALLFLKNKENADLLSMIRKEVNKA